MAHTKGPWVVTREYNVHSLGLNRSVAACGGYQSSLNQDETHLENVANAQLIAAAPDLLEACESVLAHLAQSAEFDRLSPEDQLQAELSLAQKLRAAIRKAKGEL